MITHYPPVITNTGTTGPIILDVSHVTFSVGLSVLLTGSSAGFMQFCCDDPDASYATDYNLNGNWFNVDTFHFSTNLNTGSTFASLNVPCRAVRFVVSQGAGTAKFSVVQSHAG